MISMKPTSRQQQVLGFIRSYGNREGQTPSLREIARHFRFRSMTAALDHVRALQRKGLLRHRPRRARSHGLLSSVPNSRRSFLEIPIFGSIPAGYAEEQQPAESQACLVVDVGALDIRPTARTFALQVRGDSMIGKHILAGDYVIFEHGIAPRSGDVVAALIDNENTLKTFIMERGKPWLRAENPRFPSLIPASELVIQGVMVGLIRKRK